MGMAKNKRANISELIGIYVPFKYAMPVLAPIYSNSATMFHVQNEPKVIFIVLYIIPRCV